MIRYAKLDSQILDVKSARTPIRQASLAKFAEFDEYNTSDGFLYVRIRAISSRVNYNHDSWPSVELAGSTDVFNQHRAGEGFVVNASKDAKFGFSTFLGKPVFVDHNNSDPKRARGVVVDAKLHIEDHKTAALDPFYSSAEAEDYHLPPTWVELLLEVDAKTFPKLAKALVAGAKDSTSGIDGFSMGCNIRESYCNICNNKAEDESQFCDHIRMKGAQFSVKNPKTSKKILKRSAEKCVGVGFFELSCVFQPADSTALTRELISSIRQEGGQKVASNWNRMLKTGAVQPPLNPQRHCPSCGVGTLDPDHGMTCTSCGFSESGGGRMAAGMEPDPNALGQERYFEMPCPHCKGQGIINGLDCTNCGGDGMLNDGAYAMPRGDITGLTGRNPEDYPPMPQPLQDALMNTPTHQGNKTSEILPGQYDVNGPGAMPGQHGQTRLNGTCPNCQADGFLVDDPQHGIGCNACGWGATSDQPPFRDLAHGASLHTAESPAPQIDLLSVPEKVDTLRKMEVCPTCGTERDKDEKCPTCGYAPEPDSLANPDINKAREDSRKNMTPDGTRIDGYPDNLEQARTPPPRQVAPNFQSSASIINDMDWTFYHPKLGMGKINPVERPVLPTGPPATNEPTEIVVSQPSGPVTSRTAASMIAAVKQKENYMKTADLPDAATPDANVDVIGVGGVMDASNEAASKAQAQVNVLDVGGTPVTDVEADGHDSMQDAAPNSDDSGFNTDHTTDDSGPTMTWDLSYGGDSGVETQEEPVTSEPYPASEDGVKAAALDAEPYPSDGGPGLAGGGANRGTEPIDPVGKAEDRVDVLSPATTPSNNSGPTITWTGTDGNSYSRQQDPVTNETLVGADGVRRAAFNHFVQASRLADMEVEAGTITKEEKHNYLAALADTHPAIIEDRIATLSRVKTAGLRKTPSVIRTAGRLPAFNKTASSSSAPAPVLDEALFMD